MPSVHQKSHGCPQTWDNFLFTLFPPPRPLANRPTGRYSGKHCGVPGALPMLTSFSHHFLSSSLSPPSPPSLFHCAVLATCSFLCLESFTTQPGPSLPSALHSNITLRHPISNVTHSRFLCIPLPILTL